MTKRNGLRIALVATLLASVSLQSSGAALAQAAPPAGGLAGAIGGIFGGGRATKIEQLSQIAIANQQLEGLLQMLETIPIGAELQAIFDQMQDVNVIVKEVVSTEVPEKFTQSYDTMKPLDYKLLSEERLAYLEEIDAEIAQFKSEIALDPAQLDTLGKAANLSLNPPSDISAIQAQIIGDTSRLEQSRRDTALRILENKRAEIVMELERGEINAHKAMSKCVRTNVCE